MNPEAKARVQIDQLLQAAGWQVCHIDQANLHASQGVAIREFPLNSGHGFADYLLYVNGKVCGVIEAKKEGVPLKGVEVQSNRYAQGLPATLPAWRRPLPFLFESTGVETQFTNGLDPQPRSRRVFAFYRPELLAQWLAYQPAQGQSAANDTPQTFLGRMRDMPELVTQWGQGGASYPDRIELSNPGSLLVSRAQLLQGGVSECRNKSLQLMFQLMGGGDKAGSGMDKIRAGWRAQHWRSPRLEESLQPDRVKLVLPMVSLIPDEVDRALRQRFGDRFAQLDKTAVQAVVTAQVEGSVTNGRMQEITGEHSKDITVVLQTLVRDGLLTQQNQRRWASYRVAGDSPHNGVDSPHKNGDSPHNGVDSLHKDGDSPRSDPLLWSIGEPARAKERLAPETMKALILEMCTERWLSAKEIAEVLNRDPQKIQARFLTMMVRESLLELRHPGVPNRPDQAYRTLKK